MSERGIHVVAYEDLVRTYWKTYRPAEVARMGSSGLEAFVEEKAEEIEEALQDRAEELAPPLRDGMPLMERVGEMKQARFEARSEVLQELVYGVPKEPGTEMKDMPRVTLPPLDA